MVLLGCLHQEAIQHLDGVGATIDDVIARVSTQQSFHLDAASVEVGWHLHLLIGELTHRIHTTSTADENLTFVF